MTQEEFLNSIAASLDRIFNKDNAGTASPEWGFALLVFPFDVPAGEQRPVNYVSNGKRDDMWVAMKELIARWEGRVQEGGPSQ